MSSLSSAGRAIAGGASPAGGAGYGGRRIDGPGATGGAGATAHTLAGMLASTAVADAERNPFVLPSDEDVFNIRKLERQRKQEVSSAGWLPQPILEGGALIVA
jgi:hypothetical protein